MFRINANTATPIYQQVVDQIRRQTTSGLLRPGDALPSVRTVAAEHAVNAMTISKAYSLLESEGLLSRLRGKGMVIAEKEHVASAVDRLAELETPIQQLILAAKQLDLTSHEVLAEVKRRMED